MAREAVKIPGPLGQRPGARLRYRLWRALLPPARLLGAAGSRLLDIVIAITLLLILAPLVALRGVASLVQAGRLFDTELLIGRYRAPMHRLRFAGRGPLRGLAVWFSLLKGDLALVGPRPLSEAEAAVVPVTDAVRFSVRPGLVSPFGVKRQVGLAHVRESRIDRDFVYAQSLKGDLGLAARSVVAGALGGGGRARAVPPVLNFFGIPVLNTSMAEAVAWLIDASAPADDDGSGPRQLAFVNPDCLNIAWHDADYREALLAAARVLPDGIGIHIGCRMQGVALRENVNGTDLFPLLCAEAAAEGRLLFLLGARPGIAAAAAAHMQQRYPTLRIAGTQDGYFDSADEQAVIDQVNASGAELLLVAFGAPRQDIWLYRHRHALKPPVCLGVGGLFDFYSGRIPRAPVWMREVGLEWAYRLMQEPGRMWRRYVIGNPLFLFRVWRQTLNPERFALRPPRPPMQQTTATAEPAAPR
jgi:N-acetylglucosaminyldiphosphoundecaprenol N-acetyl-beta-D-mannosaminyltransferase